MNSVCDCDQKNSESLISLSEALSQLTSKACTKVGAEYCPINKASGRVLAEDYFANYAVPPGDNSAMDGYALRFEDLTEDLIVSVTQRIPAGVLPESLSKGTCARIFTGALIPEGADTVLMQEEIILLEDGRIKLPSSIRKGANVRKKGEDLSPGSLMVAKGTRLGPAECGVLASQGVDSVAVFRPLKVAILSTGDELIEPSEPWSEGKLFNSNRYTLTSGITSLGMEIVDIGIVKDTSEITRQKLIEASRTADIIISTGGVSVGEEDHVRHSVATLGHLDLWGIAIKPGKPFAYGEVLSKPFIGLPGNPVASLVTFDLLAVPFLKLCQGRSIKPFPRYSVKSGFSRMKTIPREEFVRVQLIQNNQEQVALCSGRQGSGILSTACHADGYLIISPNTSIEEGKLYDYVPFTEFRW